MPGQPFRLVQPADGSEPLVDASVHLLPAHIEHDGPARVSTYFLPRPDDEAPDSDERLATFRGRLLRGTPIALPAGFEGRILRAPRIATVTKVQGKGANGGLKRPAPIGSAGAGPGVGALKKRRTSPRKVVQQQTRMAFSLDDETPPGSPEAAASPSAPVVTSPYFSPLRRGRSATASPAKAATTVKLETEVPAEGTSSFIDPLAALFDDADEDVRIAEADGATTSATRDLTTTARFDRFTVWTVDGMRLDRSDDLYARAIDEWCSLSSLVRRLLSPVSQLTLAQIHAS